MTDKQYRKELKRIERLSNEAPDTKDFLTGYKYGLSRGMFGDSAVPDIDHDGWMEIQGTQQGAGYRAGLFESTRNHMGRPKVGKGLLPNIKVPAALKLALEERAKKEGISLAEFRRKAYYFAIK